MGNPRTAEMAALPVSPEVPNSIKNKVIQLTIPEGNHRSMGHLAT